jgi:hypothetical protein
VRAARVVIDMPKVPEFIKKKLADFTANVKEIQELAQ